MPCLLDRDPFPLPSYTPLVCESLAVLSTIYRISITLVDIPNLVPSLYFLASALRTALKNFTEEPMS